MSGSIPSAGNFSIHSAFQAIQGIWRDLALLKKQIPSYAEGIVTEVSPLEVTPDGSTEPVLITRTLASVKTGDRVQIRYQNNRCTLLAVVGGGPRVVDGWLEEPLVAGQYRWTRHWRDTTPLPITTAWGTTAFYATKACPALPAGAVLGRLEAVSLSGSYWCNCTDSMLQVQFMRPNSTTIALGVSVSLTAYGTKA